MNPLKDIPLEAAGGGIAGLGALWVMLRHWAVQSATDGAAIDAAHAKSDMINLLLDEVKRLSEVNKTLVKSLNDATFEISFLQAEVAALRVAVNGVSGVVDTIAHRKTDTPDWVPENERRSTHFRHIKQVKKA